ncbi:MAG: hypothetical protein O2975_00175, partial [Proteobacteria bacterium]|nr:hypothetical protein [Pseudomonadota bacterium]
MLIYQPSEQLCSVLHFTTHSGMEAFHSLAADADVSPEELAVAQAACTLALGRLDGLLVGLTDAEKRLFCVGLLRTVLLSALVQAGFADADQRFNTWFAGL